MNTIESRYDEFVEYNFISNDELQRNTLKKIYQIWLEKNKTSFLNNILSKKNIKSGIYLHGSVGTGKTFVLNIFCKFIRSFKKYHFNHFMNELHVFINNPKNKELALENFIKSISKKYNIIFLDELHIFNIVDALIIKKVFLLLKKYNVFILVSSNFKPDELYKNGLRRGDFISFIDFIKEEFQIINFNQNRDYRRLMLNQSKTYFTPINSFTILEFKKLFNRFVDKENIFQKKIKINSREIIFSQCSSNVAFCTFDELCSNNYGSEDYQKISEEFNLLFIEKVPVFNEISQNECRRFISLIDMLYVQNRSVVILAQKPIKQLCNILNLETEFNRTASRLYEMTIMRPS